MTTQALNVNTSYSWYTLIRYFRTNASFSLKINAIKAKKTQLIG